MESASVPVAVPSLGRGQRIASASLLIPWLLMAVLGWRRPDLMGPFLGSRVGPLALLGCAGLSALQALLLYVAFRWLNRARQGSGGRALPIVLIVLVVLLALSETFFILFAPIAWVFISGG